MEDNRNACVMVSVAVTKAHSSEQVSAHGLQAVRDTCISADFCTYSWATKWLRDDSTAAHQHLFTPAPRLCRRTFNP